MLALIDEFGFETDRRLVGDDLHVVIGDSRKQRARRDIGQGIDLAFGAAFFGQLGTKIGHRGIFDPGGEIKQDTVRAKIGEIFGIEILDRGEIARIEQAGPMIVGPHLHAPLVLADRAGRGFVQIVIIIGFGAEFDLGPILALLRRIAKSAAIGVHIIPRYPFQTGFWRNMVN